MPVWCFFHLSNFWLISQLHYVYACFRSSTQHSSLCANRLSASLRLRVQLRGDSLISHLAVLFLSCRVIMPEVDGQVRNGLYLKEKMNSSEITDYFCCLHMSDFYSNCIVFHCNLWHDQIKTTKWICNNACNWGCPLLLCQKWTFYFPESVLNLIGLKERLSCSCFLG